MTNRWNLIVLGLIVWNGPTLALAAGSPLDRAAPEARERFEAVAASYKALSAYEDHGQFTRTIRLAGKERTETAPLSLRLARPNRIVLDAGEVRVLGDGTTLTTVLVPTRNFLAAPSPATLDLTTIADGPAGAILLGGASGPPAQLLLKLVLGVDPASALPDRATGIRTDADRTWEGGTYQTLRIEQGDEPPLRVLIDPATRLIRRMEYVLEEKGLEERVPSAGGLTEMTIAWNSGPIDTKEIARESFAFRAPDGFQRIRAAEAKPAVAAEPKNDLVGKIAPDFSLTVLDGAGKTKTVTRADLAGKVVLIDFWATWCPPCLAELPEIQKIAESYARSGQDRVVIVAVSQDRAPEDGSPVRKLVEDLLETKSLGLNKGPIARVALDPDQTVGDAFKVQALPTVVILDAKGIVQSVHVGNSDDVKDVLTADIDALLEGKSLASPKPDPEANKDEPRTK